MRHQLDNNIVFIYKSCNASYKLCYKNILITANWQNNSIPMDKKTLILVLPLVFLSQNLFSDNTRYIETPDCYSDSYYFRAKAQSFDDSAHNLILLINALAELVEMKMANITVFEGMNSWRTKFDHAYAIGDSMRISSEMNNIIRTDDQFLVEFMASNYSISMEASIMAQNVIYDEQVTGFERNEDFVFSAWGNLNYNGVLVYNLLDVVCDKVLYYDIKELNYIYNLLSDYLQELGFGITVGSTGNITYLCLEISLDDAKKSIKAETETNN